MPRKAILVLVVVVVAALGIGGVSALLASRDDSTVSPAAGPGAVRPAGAQPVVTAGNVVLLYSDERLTRRLHEVATAIGGPPDKALAAAGQAVIVRRQPNLRVAVVALTATHRLDASGPDDPALRAFAEYWLGRDPGR
jgi:hypothetical protein